MTADFLLELLSEEIPARMQDKASADLARLFAAEIAKAGLTAAAIETFATPRRLALIARGLPLATTPVREEVKGPRADAPAQALAGFLGKTGLTREQLVERADAKGNIVLFAVTEKPGRPTADVLAEAIPAIVRAFPWPKSMRWGEASAATTSLRWVRPLSGIVALLGEMVVPLEVDGIASTATTVGHRFHHPGIITIGSAADYADKLRMCHVIVSADERRAIIRDRIATLAADAGLVVVPDEGLVAENAGLTEWPVPLLGSFDPDFLTVPREVIQLTLRTNQKYFVLSQADGSLAPNFICTANIDAADGGAAIVEGNRKVLSARLSDARFFWEQDLKVPLAVQAEKLNGIVFHEKLGTIADKVDRVAKLAKWLVEEGIVPAAPSPLRGEGRGEGSDGLRPSPPHQPQDHPHPTLSLKGEGAVALAPTQDPSVTPAQAGVAPGSDAASGPTPADNQLVTPAQAGVAPGSDAPSSPAPAPASAGATNEAEVARLANLAEQAAKLCKADLVTGMVGEFPELQGVMGGYYAAAEGLPVEVSDAIRDHYKPVGQNDDVPNASVTVAVSLADKLDTLISFFTIDERPTGSKDPFALRRAALGVTSLIFNNNIRLSVKDSFFSANKLAEWSAKYAFVTKKPDNWRYIVDQLWASDKPEFEVINPRSFRISVNNEVLHATYNPESDGETLEILAPETVLGIYEAFLIDRLKVQQREAGVRHDLIDAVFALGGEDDLVRLLARVHALQAFVQTEDGANLRAGYKRAANILAAEGRKDGNDFPTTTAFAYTALAEEQALLDALDAAEPAAAQAVADEDFAGAMRALAALRAPIDGFFDKVTVNDPDPAKRAARLGLLVRIRDAVHRVADFSRIEG